MSPKDLIDDDRSRKSVEKQDDCHVSPEKGKASYYESVLALSMSFNEVAHLSC